MASKYSIWYAIAVALTVINLVAIPLTVRPNEPWHAATHAALALAFGLWAQRLRRRPGGSELPPSDRLEALETEVTRLRQELTEAQERLDFAERLLAQVDKRRVSPER
jgi:HAMP domain-containing protein